MGCTVCFEGFGTDDDAAQRPVALVPCGHIFHHGCVVRMLQSRASTRLADANDVKAYEMAVKERRRHPLFKQRVGLFDRSISVTAALALVAGRDEAAEPSAGPSRPRITPFDTVGSDNEGDSEATRGQTGRQTRSRTRPFYDQPETDKPTGSLAVSSPIVKCPNCQTICPVEAILNLWPSDEDDLDWYRHFYKRAAAGPSAPTLTTTQGIDPDALFEDMVQFRKCLSSYVMHTHGVHLQIREGAQRRTMQMVERLVPDDYKAAKLKQALESLNNAVERFASAEQTARDLADKLRQREEEVAQLQKLLNEKDAKLTRLSTQLARDRGQLTKDSARISKEKIETLERAAATAARAAKLEQQEREARQRENKAKMELSFGLAKRDEECRAKVDEAQALASAAEQARDEAEEHARLAIQRQQELSLKLRRLVGEREERKRAEAERDKAMSKLAALRRLHRKKKEERDRISEAVASAGTLAPTEAESTLLSSSSPARDPPSSPLIVDAPRHVQPLTSRPRGTIGPSIFNSASSSSSSTIPSSSNTRTRTSLSILNSASGSSTPSTKASGRTDKRPFNLVLAPPDEASLSLSVSREDLNTEQADMRFPMPGMNVLGMKRARYR